MRESENLEPSPFNGVLKLDRLPASGSSGVFEPGEAERRAASALLDLPELPEVRFTYTVTPLTTRTWRLKGRLEAKVVQSCVVTLEPVEARIREEVSVELWPAEQLTRHEHTAGEHNLDLSPDGPEPVENGELPLGRFVYETLASALDPYPRAAGAELPQEISASSASGVASSPFAALQKLTRK